MIRSIFAAALTLSFATSALAFDKNAYYDIQSVEVTDVTAQHPMNFEAQTFEDCNNTVAPVVTNFTAEFNPLEVLNMADVIIDQVVNLGKKIFSVLENGRPVVNIKVDTANALPKGLACWTDLSGWNMPESRVYNVRYKNGFGMNVVDFSYRVTYTAGGSVDGVGQYITNATFMPANVNVGWGFNLDADATIPNVFNTGSRTAPVAGMQMNMAWTVKTVMNHNQASETFAISGDNTLRKLQ